MPNSIRPEKILIIGFCCILTYAIAHLIVTTQDDKAEAELMQSESEWKVKVLEDKVKNMESVTAADRVQVEYNSDSTQVLITLVPNR